MSNPPFDAWLATAADEVPDTDFHRIARLQAAIAVQGNRSPLRLQDGEVSARWFGEAVALRDRSRPEQGLYNRVIGVRPGSIGDIDEWVRHYEDAGIACQVDIVPTCYTAEVRAALDRRGFAFQGSACTLAADPRALTPRAPLDVHVEDVTPDSLGEALDVLAAGRGRTPPAPDLIGERRAELARSPGYFVSLARIGGEPAAVASLLIVEGAAYLANALTLPAWRRRGCQAALLAHRVREAARRACDLIVTDTMVGMESQRNVMRAGLRRVYSAGWWCRPLA